MTRLLSIPLVVIALGASAAAQATRNDAREVRVLEADDPNMFPVLRAAAKSLFGTTGSGPVQFGGVYVGRELDLQLTTQIRAITGGGSPPPSGMPADCNPIAAPIAMNPPPPPTDPATGRTGYVPPPAPSGPLAQTCSQSAVGGGYYSLHTVRIASDTAYVEVQARTPSDRSTHCLVLAVADSGGWKRAAFKRGKINQCGK